MDKSNHAGTVLACVVIDCLIVLIGIILSITVTNLLATSLEKKISTTVQSGFYDNFQGNTYLLGEGQTSPNGKWKSVYSGYGWVGTVNDNSTSGSANNYFFEQPKTSTHDRDYSCC
jgi:hypothetical protein